MEGGSEFDGKRDRRLTFMIDEKNSQNRFIWSPYK